jgi:hypothetical protein
MNTVELIHAEFDQAQELILKEALEIIKHNTIENSDHVESLKKLGFVNTEIVEKSTEKIKKVKMGKHLADTVVYYKQAYPFLKFITEEKLDQICEKWGLVYASVKAYKKDVPAKNVKELLNVQPLKSYDARPTKYKFSKLDCSSSHGDDVIKWLTETEFDFDPCGRIIGVDDMVKKMCPYKYDSEFYLYWTGSRSVQINKDGLFIAAPANHFNLNGLDKKGKFGFFEKIKTKVVVNDPIVFRYVKGGIQILSKWGLEAEDIDILNEINN